MEGEKGRKTSIEALGQAIGSPRYGPCNLNAHPATGCGRGDR